MRGLNVEILKRSIASSRIPFLAAGNVSWRVNSLKVGLGGPLEASVTGYGSKEEMFEMLESLGGRLVIRDSEGIKCWWGFIEEVQVRIDALEVSLSLRYMANKVAVEFNNITPGQASLGDAVLTDWATDNASVATYGTKELKSMLNDATQDLAEATRDRILNERKFPIPDWYPSGQVGSYSCTLLAAGWWHTLDWEYWEYLSGYQCYKEGGEGVQAFGNVSATQQVAQSFQLSGSDPWSTVEIRLKVRKEGAPTDNLTVALCSDSSGVPGTTLATSTVAGANVSTDYNWIAFELSSRVNLSISTTYWIKVYRSGGLDNDDYFLIDVNEELGYTSGVFRIWDGSWYSRNPDADMLFEVIGELETTVQLENIGDHAQFIGSVSIQDDSSMYNCPYRPGDFTLKSDAEDLLKAGTSNNRRLWCWIDEDRNMLISEEPARPSPSGNPAYYLRSDGVLAASVGGIVPMWRVPVGVWAALDFLPPSLDTTLMSDPGVVFIEAFEYDGLSHRASLYLRGIPEVSSMGLKLSEER